MPKTILIVDNNDGGLAELANVLESNGYAPLVLTPGDDPVAQFGLILPELVFLNLNKSDALAYCEGIREHPEGAIVPIIFVGTGAEQVGSPSDALTQGGDYYFSVPLNEGQILAKVQTYVGPGEEDVAPQPSPPPVDETVPKAPILPAAGTRGAPPAPPQDAASPPAPLPNTQPFEDGFPSLPDFGWDSAVTAPSVPSAPLTDASDSLMAAIRFDEAKATKEKAEEEARQKAKEEEKQKAEEARLRAEEEAKQREEEEARLRAEEEARRQAQDEARRKAEEEARLRAEEEARLRAEEEARRQAQDEARRQAQDEARRQAQDEARRKAEDEARRQAQDEARKRAEEEARRKAEEAARQQAEQEARQKEEQEARLRAEEDFKRQAEEEARRRVEEEVRRRLEEELRQKAEEEERLAAERARRSTEEEVRLKAERERQRKAEEESRLAAEREIRRQAEEAARLEAQRRALLEAEERERLEAERQARLKAEEEARQKAEEEARRKLHEEEARRKEERDRLEMEERIRREVEAKLQRDAEKKAQLAAEAQEEANRLAAEERRQARNLPSDNVNAPPAPQAWDEPTVEAPRLALHPEIAPFNPTEGVFSLSADISRLLFGIWEQRTTGRIDFASENHKKTVFFERGAPVDAYSSQVFDRMEEYLYRDGKITRAQYQEVRVKGLRNPRRIGAHLVTAGHIKPTELFTVVRGHLREVVVGLFEWEEGTYQYLPERAEEDDRVMLRTDPRALITDGIRRKFLMPRLMDLVGAPSSLLAPKKDATPDTDALELSKEEQQVVRLLDGTRSIEDLVFSTGLSAHRVYHVLAALLAAGYAEIRVRGIEGVGEDGTSASDAIDRQRLKDKAEQVRKLDYFQILGVPQAATPYEIDRAYERIMHEFQKIRFSEAVQRELATELLEISSVLEDARQVLRNEGLRDAYARHLPSH